MICRCSGAGKIGRAEGEYKERRFAQKEVRVSPRWRLGRRLRQRGGRGFIYMAGEDKRKRRAWQRKNSGIPFRRGRGGGGKEKIFLI